MILCLNYYLLKVNLEKIKYSIYIIWRGVVMNMNYLQDRLPSPPSPKKEQAS